jgi:molybdenum cofactor guanylyltransferase
VYHGAMEEVSAFILAGGKSSRMGRDKAFLPMAGKMGLERALEVARAATGRVFIVGDGARLAAFGPMVEDIYRERGPLSGIHAALLSSTTELNLVMAVDQPFLSAPLLKFLIEVARASRAVVTVPRAEGRLQPLCAVYRKGFAETAETALREGKNKIDSLFAGLAMRVVEQAELLQAGFTPQMFLNVNTPEEYDDAVERLRKITAS